MDVLSGWWLKAREDEIFLKNMSLKNLSMTIIQELSPKEKRK